MCIIINSTWAPCGHRAQRIQRCKKVAALLDLNGDTEGYTFCSKTSTKSVLQTLRSKFVPPLCPVGPDCMPYAYWSCCKCQHLIGAGSKGGKGCRADKGGLRQKGRTRRARFAPSFTGRNAFVMLRHGRVCMGDAYEEEPSLASIVEVDESQKSESEMADIKDDSSDLGSLDEKFSALTLDYDSEDIASIEDCDMQDMSDSEMVDSEFSVEEAPMSDYEDSDGEMDTNEDSEDNEDNANAELSMAEKIEIGCNHYRCDKCLQWRRCPCGCHYRRIIPITHRRCDKCARDKCIKDSIYSQLLPAEEEIE